MQKSFISLVCFSFILRLNCRSHGRTISFNVAFNDSPCLCSCFSDSSESRVQLFLPSWEIISGLRWYGETSKQGHIYFLHKLHCYSATQAVLSSPLLLQNVLFELILYTWYNRLLYLKTLTFQMAFIFTNHIRNLSFQFVWKLNYFQDGQ